MYSTIMGFYEDYMKITILNLICLYVFYSYTILYIYIYKYDSIFDSIGFMNILLIMMFCIVPF